MRIKAVEFSGKKDEKEKRQREGSWSVLRMILQTWKS